MTIRTLIVASLVLWGTRTEAQEVTKGAAPRAREAAPPAVAVPAGVDIAAAVAPAEVAPSSSEAPANVAKSQVTAVTVYQGNALVTRLVDVPDGKGLVEVVVTPLPPSTVDSSLYAEGTDGLRVLSSRYRTRAVKEDTRAEVRAKEAQIRTLKLEAERLKNEAQTGEQNLQLLTKLENFTTVTMQNLAEKGLLNSESTLSLAKYVMTTRVDKAAAQVALQQKLQSNTEATEFAGRELTELTSGSGRTERDAVIVVDRAGAGGKVRLNYLVTDATWRPQYRFRAGAEKSAVQLEYLAAIEQMSGEDWTGVDMTLSTAQPQLNATPPELLALDITVVGRGAVANLPQQGQGGGMGGMMGGGRMAGFSARGKGRCFAINRASCAKRRRLSCSVTVPRRVRISSTKRLRWSKPTSFWPRKMKRLPSRHPINPALPWAHRR